MVTQVQLPAPPVMVNIGERKGSSSKWCEFKSIFVKPSRDKDDEHVITTENGIYTFILKENPFRPWDIRVA